MSVNKKNVFFRHKLLPLLLGSVLSGVLFSGCSPSGAPQQQAPQALPVTVLTVQPQNVPQVLEIMAQTEGAKEAEVRARVGGILMKQFYREGERVKEGQPLFLIDRAPYEIAHAEAKARADQTAREMARAQKLLDINGVSRREYDDAVSMNDMAQAALRQAQLNLSWTSVAAPVDGISGRAAKSVGNLVTVGVDSLLTTVYQNDPIWARFSLGESDTAKLPGGRLTPEVITGVELILPDGAKYPLPGKLNFLASSIDTTLGTQQMRAEFPNPDGILLPGQFVRARLIVGERQGVYLVPQTAVLQTDQGDILMLADKDDKIAPRPVQTGDWYGTNWIVTSGLQAGDRVIIDNLLKLRPGNPVAPHAPQTPHQAPADAPAAGETPATAPVSEQKPAQN
ncbi:MexE family multidrug efflux RND transporter periplasmic adaptor subunit [Betaproteobacteria bacterium]|nr:MexE family multidrug efflux RND transporter periplasmic adaptor subunit [Betaproteobacteria bacterium]